ncbi:hypothetical protein AAIB41_01205 [Brucella sp. BE17]|uniref:hypothetical protein n=1 Tax=Brucella sp. BE17 TaxID=3142977 RepID=UPI0031BAB068
MRPLLLIATIGTAFVAAYFMMPPITIGERGQGGYEGPSTLTEADIQKSAQEAEDAVRRAEEVVNRLNEIKNR